MLTRRKGPNGHRFSEKPYKITDRRSSSGWVSSNVLYDGANTNAQRKSVTNQDRDFHRIISPDGRRQLMSVARWLYANEPTVHGSLLEQANLATGSFIPQFDGEDKEWGKQAEDWLYEWHKIMDFRGAPFDYETWTMFLVLVPLRCGDMGTLLVSNRDNYPFIQVIPPHRIGCNTSEARVSGGGQFDGARIIDGVIVNDYGQAMGYRVWDSTIGSSDFEDISARNMMLTYWPEYPDQVRGITALASGVKPWQDKAEAVWNELIAQKALSAPTIIETNEIGAADSAKSVIKTLNTPGTSTTQTTPAVEELAAGTIRYLKANTGSSITTLQHNRPGQNAMAFLESCARDAFNASEWNYFFSLDPKGIGGGPMRVIVDRINRVIKKRRSWTEKACRRVDGWALSKAIENKELPANDEWFKWTYQGTADVTADRKYDSDVDLQEYKAGFRSLRDICERRNLWYLDVMRQRAQEEKDEIEMRKEMGLPPKPVADPNASPIPNRTRREPQNDPPPEDDPEEQEDTQEEEEQ